MKKLHRVACTLLSVAAMLTPAEALAAVLGPGFTLAPGQSLHSADGAFFAMLTHDGNFSIYRASDGAVAWSSGTVGSGAVSASMQRTGRLTLLDSSGTPVWATPTRGRHRVFGVTTWGTAIVLDARRWKPRRKEREPIVEQMIRRRARIHWQSTSFNQPPKWREKS